MLVSMRLHSPKKPFPLVTSTVQNTNAYAKRIFPKVLVTLGYIEAVENTMNFLLPAQ